MTAPTPPTRSQLEALQSARKLGEAELQRERPAKATRTLTWLLDDLVPLPGTRMRFGLDPLFSIIPWAGTATGAVLGTVVLFDAVRLRMPLPILARMLTNWAIDWLVGLIPYAGPVLDFTWRSNKKNLVLLNRTIDDRQQVHAASITYWIVAVASVVSVVLSLLLLPLALILVLASGS